MNSEIINTSVEEYKELVESLHSENYEMMVDLTVVDLHSVDSFEIKYHYA